MELFLRMRFEDGGDFVFGYDFMFDENVKEIIIRCWSKRQ